jgi:hypothetical protein
VPGTMCALFVLESRVRTITNLARQTSSCGLRYRPFIDTDLLCLRTQRLGTAAFASVRGCLLALGY